MSSILVLVDAAINLAFGLVLVCFRAFAVEVLGLPQPTQPFYPSILGAVLIGIAIALFIESQRKQEAILGLGLGGAVAINLCGGLCLAGWLVFGGLEIPVRGHIILWNLVMLLAGISGVELLMQRRQPAE